MGCSYSYNNPSELSQVLLAQGTLRDIDILDGPLHSYSYKREISEVSETPTHILL